MLRHLACDLPIQLWHFEHEIDDIMRTIVDPLGVACVNADEYRQEYNLRILGGWEVKAVSLRFCPYKEVLLLDADNVPVQNPFFLFECGPFRETGAVFWPDYGKLAPDREIWGVFETPNADYPDQHEFESGQVLLNKELAWRPLCLTVWMNEHSDYFYRFIHGDKCTFEMAWKRLRAPFHLIPKPIHTLAATMCQHSPVDGSRLFQHRNLDKWTLDGSNRKIHDFWYEDLCRRFLSELRARWTGRPFFSEEFRGTAAFQEVAGNRFIYRRLGHDERIMEFRVDGTIGQGSAHWERFWCINRFDDEFLLSILGNEPICHLKKGPHGVWTGSWLHFEKMPIELLPVGYKSQAEQDLIAQLENRQFIYRRVGYDHRVLAFLEHPRMGEGSAGYEQRWDVVSRDGETVIVISSETEPICYLYLFPDGIWRGRWLRFEKMAIELVEQSC
jgi:hypothetical protein